MPKILIVKTSSMGDIIHTLPALSDAARKLADLSCDWVVEPAFAEIPLWHEKVNKVIPAPIRKFRKQPFSLIQSGEVRNFLIELRKEKYDFVIDAQGLIKSGVLARAARGLRCGLDRNSAWEPLASFVYQKKVNVPPAQHAITRMRQLFSKVLDYPLEDTLPNYGLEMNFNPSPASKPYVVFIHGTTWITKEWPELYWLELAEIAVAAGFEVLLPWGNSIEQQRATRIQNGISQVTVIPKTSLTKIAEILSGAKGVISVDTGLGHLAAALNLPNVSLYGPTDPQEIGTKGRNQVQLAVNFECAPCGNQKCNYRATTLVTPACFTSLKPPYVWEQLVKVMEN